MNREDCIYIIAARETASTHRGTELVSHFTAEKKIPFGNLKLGDVKNRKIRFEVRAKLWPC